MVVSLPTKCDELPPIGTDALSWVERADRWIQLSQRCYGIALANGHLGRNEHRAR
ncbi:MAG: hypothetical protein HC800_09810 [Phormidesmis sp. RL_2_1]|nr:hypothetical protein [Phormidesmis sp. RL_2_1]